MPIKFGTSGWRAIIADEFTFANVRLVTRAICDYLRTSGVREGASLVVSYDTRFLGEKFAAQCVNELAANGLNAIFCDQPTPTPTISHTIRERRAAGGINFTASHNPPEYNGMKFSTADGAPALPDATKQVEGLIKSAGTQSVEGTANNAPSKVEVYDPRPAYFADLETKIRFDTLTKAGDRYAYDPLWGTGR